MSHALRLAIRVCSVFCVAFLTIGCGGEKTTKPPAGMYSVIETFAGTGGAFQGEDGLPPTETALYTPQDINFGPDGKPYILDWNNHRIRVIENGIMRTLIGTGGPVTPPGVTLTEGPANEIDLNHPTHVSFDPFGNLVLSAWHNSMLMTVDLATEYIKPYCGNGTRAFTGDGGPPIDATLNLPVSTVWDSQGRMYIMDQANQRVRVIENGIISTYAGNGEMGFAGDGGLAVNGSFSFPVGQAAWPAGKIAIDANGNIYVPDTNNHRVRVIGHALPGSPGLLPGHEEDTYIRTIAGNGEFPTLEDPFIGDGGPATEARLKRPGGVGIGPEGNLYIADTYNHAIRKVDENGIITTFAGQPGVDGYNGDGRHPKDALLARPTAVSFDAAGNLYIADSGNHRIRVIRRNP